MNRGRREVFLFILLAVMVLSLTGCDRFMGEIIEYSDYLDELFGPIDVDDTPHLSNNGKDSYLPIVEGFSWRYEGTSTGGTNYKFGDFTYSEVTPDADDPTQGYTIGDYYIRHDSGSQSCSGCSDLPLYIMLALNYTSSDMFPEEGTDIESLRGTSQSSVNPDSEFTYAYSSDLEKVVTPEGKIFEDCIHYELYCSSYSGGTEEYYQKNVDVYFAKGIGIVYAEIERYSGEKTVVYLTHHSTFGETLRLYDADGTTLLDDAEVYEAGKIVRLPGRYRDGYVLDNWNTRKDGNGDAFEPGDEFIMPDADVNLYAVWVADPSEGV